MRIFWTIKEDVPIFTFKSFSIESEFVILGHLNHLIKGLINIEPLKLILIDEPLSFNILVNFA